MLFRTYFLHFVADGEDISERRRRALEHAALGFDGLLGGPGGGAPFGATAATTGNRSGGRGGESGGGGSDATDTAVAPPDAGSSLEKQRRVSLNADGILRAERKSSVIAAQGNAASPAARRRASNAAVAARKPITVPPPGAGGKAAAAAATGSSKTLTFGERIQARACIASFFVVCERVPGQCALGRGSHNQCAPRARLRRVTSR